MQHFKLSNWIEINCININFQLQKDYDDGQGVHEHNYLTNS